MLESQEYQTILVGTDGSEQAKQAFEKALSVAKRNHAKIILAHINENKMYGATMGVSPFTADIVQDEVDHAKLLLEEYAHIAQQQGFEELTTTLEFGSPKLLMAKELPEKYDADLIMVGQSGLNAVERLVMGSVSDYVIRTAPCDVLVVRAQEQH